MHSRCQLLLGGVRRIKTISTGSVQISRKQFHVFSLLNPDEKSADVREFRKLYPTIVAELTTEEGFDDAPLGMKRITEILDYNMENVPVVQSQALMDTYRGFSAGSPSQEDLKLVYNMAWCLQLVELLIVMMNDVVNNVLTRRNRLAWHLLGDNPLRLAAHDSLMIEQCGYVLLKKHFGDKSYYPDVVRTIRDIINTSLLGQNIDFVLSNMFKRTRNLDIFTVDQLRDLIKHRSTLCTWYPPIIVGMIMNNITNLETRREVEGIIYQMTECFEYLENYLDCYSTKEDYINIKHGKCTWLICTALRKANPQQKSILQECYGIPEQDKVDAVMKVYQDIGVQDLSKQRYKEIYNDLEKNIQQLPKDVPKEIFTNILKRVYYRRL